MARYDYACPECNCIQEVSHSMSETPVVTCSSCGAVMRKKISSCGIIIRGSLGIARAQDSQRRDADLKSEMRESYGVENITPLRGGSTKDVYNDIKGSGSYVKEQMAAEKEKNEARRKAKMSDWKPGAQKRAASRRAEMIEKKKAEAAAKRKIVLS